MFNRAGGIINKIKPAEVTLRGEYSTAADATSYTFSSASIGAEAPDRHVIVMVSGFASASRDIASVTIGGVSANVVSYPTASFNPCVVIAMLKVPTGTTKNIVATFNGGMASCHMRVYTVIAKDLAVLDNGASTTPTVSDVQCKDKGVVFGLSAQGVSTAPTTHTWNGVDTAVEGFDTIYGDTSGRRSSGGHVIISENSSIRDYTMDNGQASTQIVVSYEQT